ncbi:ferric reductase like transmembrane component-domain-containing protein [Paraphoma chrysanthemicola]|uniref:Ferric reductase like transmembrane component-domain-containing protein n=1 Tax=Paraphoma chrysanthemicola TaxID=798071 RepID=A0A8K0RGF7_9PLEO|nr:ferric reductase like transmembrane component-domain-containing protein [Paraphoma chrysanthemicola]
MRITLTQAVYQPNCAFACRDQFSSAHLECTSMDHGGGGHHGSSATSKECYAGNTPWLTTLAYCINATCTDVPKYTLEAYWAERVTKSERGNKLQPKWTYQETLEQMAGLPPPTKELEEDEELNFTALYNSEAWESTRGALQHFELAESMHSRYGIILLVVSFGTPILLTCLTYLPYMSTIIDMIKPRLVWPSVVGSYHVRALPFSLGNVPTIGQTWYIILFVMLNIIATASGYHSFQDPSNAWFPDRWQEIMAYVSARTGVLAFALAPLTILFAGRNNLLLWLTNWSHSTYMLLHRWVARVFTLQVILHSILEFMLYKRKGTVDAEQKEPYWIWGIVATLACCIMVVVSTLYFRRMSYEIFLIVHIIMAVFVIAGSWYHVELLFERKWGYEIWLYAACGVWFLDRVIRVGRITKNGIRKAEVTAVTDEIVRIDVKDVRWQAIPGRHTYAYFPSLNPVKPWENHPFSIIPTALLRSQGHSVAVPSSSSGSQHSEDDIEKSGAREKVTPSTSVNQRSAHEGSTSGISLYVRKSTGLTKALTNHSSLTTLLDGPYPNNSTSAVLKTDRLILIAGGIGITATLPFIAYHTNVKLYWSVKSNSQGLVDDLSDVLQGLREKEVKVGSRFDVASVLEQEAAEGWKRVGVVVCGPGALCDDVRSLVAQRASIGGVKWELDVEAFSW